MYCKVNFTSANDTKDPHALFSSFCEMMRLNHSQKMNGKLTQFYSGQDQVLNKYS